MNKLRYEYLLPLGSIVQLHKSEQGISTGDKVFDYVAVPYPQGLYDPRFKIGFDQADIETVVSRGYEDEDWKAFIVFLEVAARTQEAKKQGDSE